MVEVENVDENGVVIMEVEVVVVVVVDFVV